MRIQIGRDFAGAWALLAPGVMGLLMAVIVPTLEGTAAWGWFAFSLLPGFLGGLLLAYAKWPLYRQRKFFSFGSQALPDYMRRRILKDRARLDKDTVPGGTRSRSAGPRR